MRYHVRPLLALAALVALDLANHDSLGYFHQFTFATAIIAFALALAASLMRDVARGTADAAVDCDLLAFGLTAVGLTAFGIGSVHLTFPDHIWALDAVRWCAVGGFIVCVLGLLWPVRGLFGAIDWADFRAHSRGIALGLTTGLLIIAGRVW